MSSSILNIGHSALAAAQAGLATTGHNIANASTPGYSRQVVLQGSAGSQSMGSGYIGKGTQVLDVRRVFNEMLATQMQGAHTSKNMAETYFSQVSRINNQFGDPEAGLSPVMQDFFNGLQDLAAHPNLAASRQSTISAAESLAARFRSLDGQLKEQEQNVNSQILVSIDSINAYAQQLVSLNDAIDKASGTGNGRAANDLLDQRDLVVSELSKQIKTTIVKQGDSYNVFIGNGQPLVVGAKSFQLAPTPTPTDPSRLTVGYMSNDKVVAMAEGTLKGGVLGGLLEFRTGMLDQAQNALGRIAINLASTINAQHALGVNQNGQPGAAMFTVGVPLVQSSRLNTSSPAAEVSASITDPGALTTSNYSVETLTAADPDAVPAIEGAYRIVRMSDGAVTNFIEFPQTVDGVTFSVSAGNPAAGDTFLVKPTVTGATGFSALIKDVSEIAAATPIRTNTVTGNIGTGAISPGVVNGPPPVNADLQVPVSITFTSATEYSVTRTDTDPPEELGTGDISLAGGREISFNGWSVEITGAPAAGDAFRIAPNLDGVGDNRNAVLLGALQTTNTMAGGTTSYQGAYAQLISQVGNKTREMQVTAQAESRFLQQATALHESESGVNLDEEATNIMRYQQAYQAAAKVMQAAQQVFDMLLSLG